MTQADLQRDVERLETLHAWMCETADSMDEAIFEALDRAIETARTLASMSDQQRADMAEGCLLAGDVFGDVNPDSADAHRKVARLVGGG